MKMCNPWELKDWQRNKKRDDLQQRLSDLRDWQPSKRAVYAEHSYKRDEIERLEKELRLISTNKKG